MLNNEITAIPELLELIDISIACNRNTRKNNEKDSSKNNHGRIEKTSYYLSYDINTITDKKKWETVKTIAYVRVDRTIEDEIDHWNIECSLHWRLPYKICIFI